MTFLERFKKLFGSVPNPLIFFTGWAKTMGLADSQNYAEHLKAYRSVVYMCANIRAEVVAKSKYYLYASDRSKKLEVYDHPFFDLIDKENRYGQTWYDIRYLTQVYKDLLGNAYWYIPRDKEGMPSEIIPLQAQYVTIVPKADGSIDYYIYSVNNQIIKYSADEIIHFKYPNPSSIYYGLAPLLAASYQSDIDLATSIYMKTFMENDATPKIALLTKTKLNQANFDDLANRWQEKYGGVNNKGYPAVLDNGLDIKTISLTAREADYIQTRKGNRDEIMQIFRIPPIVGNVTENSNRSTSTYGMLNFIDNTVDPIMKQESAAITSWIKKTYDKRLELQYWIERPSDIEMLLRENIAGIQYGWRSINEVRTSYGDTPVANGDDVKPWNPNPPANASAGKVKSKELEEFET